MTTIYLIRHSIPIKDKTIEQINIPLSKEGKELIHKITKNFFNKNIDKIYSSSYKRAIETAIEIAKINNKRITINNDFNERNLGTDKNVKEDFWLAQLYNENAKPTNGESRKEVKIRMLNALNNILNEHKDKNILIVSHATAITFLLMNWCKLESAELTNKKRHLTYKGKTIINDSFKSPEIFKLDFIDTNLLSIERITY